MSPTTLFFDDYSEGAHPRILEAFIRTNLQQECGYTVDSFKQEAERLIKEKINKPGAAVHFVVSGTQANLIGLSSMLHSYESVIATEHGHIAVHEAGAVEATGHKVHAVPNVDGKMTPEALQHVIDIHIDEQMVKPRAVYISQSTELGTIYSKEELQNLYQVCQQTGLYLYIDGARLGHALMAKEADFSFQDIADCCDMFTIGGTKNGALLGEAIVIVNQHLQKNFRYHLRQRGALLAKGRAVTVAFVEFFKDTLYGDNAWYANAMAEKMAQGIERAGYSLLHPVVTNQIFVVLPNPVIKKLQKTYGFHVWSKDSSMPEHSVIRLVTSWATTEAAVEAFIASLA